MQLQFQPFDYILGLNIIRHNSGLYSLVTFFGLGGAVVLHAKLVALVSGMNVGHTAAEVLVSSHFPRCHRFKTSGDL